MADWKDVRVGDVVRGRDKGLWTVTDRKGPQVTLAREGREPFTGEPKGAVEIVQRSDEPTLPRISGVDEVELATAVVKVNIGGEIIAQQDSPRRPWKAPLNFTGQHELRSHLYLLHGEFVGDVKGKGAMAELRAAHDAHHTARAEGKVPTNAWHDHEHVADWKP